MKNRCPEYDITTYEGYQACENKINGGSRSSRDGSLLDRILESQTLMIASVAVIFLILICLIVTCIAICKTYCMRIEREEMVQRRRNVNPDNRFDFNQLQQNSPVKGAINLTVERDVIVSDLRRKLKVEGFSRERAESIKPAYDSEVPIRTLSRRPDTSCAICMSDFMQFQQIHVTPCKHSFHESCLVEWIQTKTEEALKLKVRKEARGETVDFNEIGPQCPNCNASLMLAMGEEEAQAVDQIANVMDLLQSNSQMVSIVDVDDPDQMSEVRSEAAVDP
jgi:Na+-transporting methylmalonyl-CoA/oxaloacetate decarboxylase gamma subunit